MRVLMTACLMMVLGAAVQATPLPVVVPVHGSADADWHLGRAVDLWEQGDVRGAMVHLESIDIGTDSEYAQADRAAFLLAAACIESGDRARLLRVVETGGDRDGSVWRKWVAYLGLLDGVSDENVDGFANASSLAAARRLAAGEPAAAISLLADHTDDVLALHLLAVAEAEAGRDDTATLEKLARREPSTTSEAELVAAAALELAARDMAAGRDPNRWLDQVPAGGSRSLRRDHLAALVVLADGDTTACERSLTKLATEHPAYAERRAVLLELGALAAARDDWSAALAFFEEAERDHEAARQRLAALATTEGAADAWSAWDNAGHQDSEIRFLPDAAHMTLAGAAASARDLGDDDMPQKPSAAHADIVAPSTRLHDEPSPGEWANLRDVRTELSVADVDLAQRAWELDQLAADRERQAAYLATGRAKAAASADSLAAAVARLDILLARLDLAVAELTATRDHALLRFARRSQEMVEELRRNLLYMAAAEHFHVNGPSLPTARPDGVPTPGDLLELETTLAREMERFLAVFVDRSAELVNDSYARVWRPRLLGDAPTLHLALTGVLGRAGRDLALIDSTAAGLALDPVWLAASAGHARQQATRDSLATAEIDLKLVIAAAVAARGQVRLDDEREAIALHAAAAAYWLAVTAATDGPPRTVAMARHEAFLSDHPTSAARSEMRYRQADLHLLQAQEDFRTRMTKFLGEKPTSDDLQDRSLAPLLDIAPALALYRDILEDDPDYAHREAVLFSLGMILADDGGPDAEAHLEELVSVHAASPYAQEAWLRLGDLSFEQGDLSGCRERYARAAAGDDRDITGIALYKLGWARFEEDMFAEAADAFGALLDHGAASEATDSEAQDLADEAGQYLVRSLLRAGGATAFSDHFARHGARPYEAGTLRSMGRLSRRFTLHDEAIACDVMWLDRYGTRPEAVDIAARLVDTHRQTDKPEAVRTSLLAEAPRFVAGSAWYEANPDDELRERGQDFSREAYRTLATHHHKVARKDSSQVAWQTALDHYGTWLEHWPDHTTAHRMNYQAGEAAFNLDAHARAVAHFSRAATADTGSFVADAAWQVVAVTDAWYESADRPDSLATRLQASADAFRAAYPGDPHLADLAWRQANVAAAHERHEQAAGIFMAFGRTHADDPRSVEAVRRAGDAWYRLDDYARAGDAYEHAYARARSTEQDTLALSMAAAIPVCRYQHAEAVAADTTRGPSEAADLFLVVADRWPAYENTDLALYRAGLGYGDERAVSAWERLLTDHPNSAYGRDAALEIGRVHEAGGRKLAAAVAYRRFSHVYRDDPDATDAMLTAIDLSAEDPAEMRRLEDDFVTRFAGETEQVMAIRHVRATGAVAGLGGGTVTLAGLLAPDSDLSRYLEAARANPELADPRILAQVDYQLAEKAYADYEVLRLSQPLPPSLEAKKERLEDVVTLYNACAAHGVKEYAHAAAHRIGAAIVHFGDALTASERPADLQGDDLVAYEEVLEEQGWDFHARGEAAWTELLKQTRDETDDPGQWITRTRETLWPRVAMQFVHRPEVEYPLVVAAAPAEVD